MKWVFIFTAAAAYAQSTDQSGSITGTVVDAVTRMPVKKAIVTGFPLANQVQNQGPIGATTDAGGTFTIPNVGAGRYRLMFQHQNYPESRFRQVSKTVEVKAGESSSPVTVELTPGASLTGRIVDEEGDPLMNCNTQLHPLKHPEQGVAMTGFSASNEDGVYRMYGIAPGKYNVSAQCHQAVFRPRPLSVGPDPPPSKAYPMQYYPSATDAKSAQAVELTAGAEKSGVDFQMVPIPVTQIHGVIAPGSAAWSDGQINMILESSNPGVTMSSQIDHQKGAFEFTVFPGSYTLVAFANGDPENRIGGWQQIEVADKPLQIAFELKRAIEVSGRVQIEGNQNTSNPVTNSQIQITLMPAEIGFVQPPPPAQVKEDGSFTIKGIVPGMHHRIQANAMSGYLKSAWLGSTDVTNTPADFSSGGSLRVVISTNTGTIRGTAPAQQIIMLQEMTDDNVFQGARGVQVDQNGQYSLEGLRPGKYRLVLSDDTGPMPEEGGQDVTVKEGETTIVDLKPAAP